MRKSADVVTHMQPSFDYSLLFPKMIEWEQFNNCRPTVPFDDNIISMLNALSSRLLKDALCRSFTDIIAFAFFCRKANLLILKQQYAQKDIIRIGRGTIFHIAPGNVPVNFGYSLVAGLLAGNNNIVRISNKPFPQVDLIIKHLHSLAEYDEFKSALSRIVLVRYEHSSDASSYFSSICNARIIWGGDETIKRIRQNSIPSRAFDVCFADRYSFAIIKTETLHNATDSDYVRLAEHFYNDTFLFDQNACSAPHIIVWTQSNFNCDVRGKFWKALHDYAIKKYKFQPVMGIDKLTAFFKQATCMKIQLTPMPDNLIMRAELSDLPKGIENYRCACGYFSEYIVSSLCDIADIITTKYQTMAYFGFSKEELNSFIENTHLKGIDRIVPIGCTTNFSLTWDGYNLIDTLSRIVTL